MSHIKFRIDREKQWNSFLEIEGQRIRFLDLEFKSKPNELPLVKISVFATLLEGEIVGPQRGELRIIHIDESTKGLIQEGEEIVRKHEDSPFGSEDDGCPGR